VSTAPEPVIPDRPATPVVLSTASVYPESTSRAFEIAARLGYDGVEVMVTADPVSQDVNALRQLSDYHEMPIAAIHAPCLLITQRVWGVEPWIKLAKAQEVASELGAGTVVVHPPFRWQRDYAREFVSGLAHISEDSDVVFAVENMFPWRAGSRELVAYAPEVNVVDGDYPFATLDLSHTATAQTDAIQMYEKLGDRLAHVHLADGSGSGWDEHLVPGRGSQPCAELLGRLAADGYRGTIVLEINTRRAPSNQVRESDLVEALAFTRLHLVNGSATT